MFKPFAWIGTAIVLFVLAVIGLGMFLAPDDLQLCDERPDLAGDCRAADAIIAVSGGNTAARAQSAIQLYKQGWASQIIFSGAARDTESQSNAAAMRDLAIKAGVPTSAVILDETSKTTLENAVNVAEILYEKGIENAIITTSPYHMRRTFWEFERAAPDIQFRNHPATDTAWNLWFIKPTGWWRVLNELGGLALFGLRGLF